MIFIVHCFYKAITFSDEYSPMDDLAGVVIDDDAESELHQVLERARKLKNKEAAEKAKTQEDVAVRVRDMLSKHGGPVKMEVDDDEEEVRLSSLLFMRQVAPEEDDDPNAVVIDATKEYCRNIGKFHDSSFEDLSFED